MTIKLRRYQRDKDYDRVGRFLLDTFRPGRKHTNWQRSRWEYMHFHPWLVESELGSIGLWEDGGKIVAMAHYELYPGDVYLQVHPAFTHLKREMVEYAEENLSITEDGGRPYLKLYVNDFDEELQAILGERGYRKIRDEAECWSEFKINDPFPKIKLPNGFRLTSLYEEDDLLMLDRLIHRGFNHPGEPPEGGEQRMKLMQSAPNYRKDLNVVVQDKDGTYASYCGMWYEPEIQAAYVEPVCTDPDYRRLGLGTAAVLEGIRRCGLNGATVAFVGSEQPFYLSFGFNKLFDIQLWTNEAGG